MKTDSTIRLAQASDEPELLNLLQLMWREAGWRPLDLDCARAMFARAFDKRGGLFPVIGPPGQIRAMMFILMTTMWYTRDLHLEELFCWVHPDHRRSDYHKLLIDYAKTCSDELSARTGRKIPLFMAVLTNRRMTAKVRLYRRFFGLPMGAFFMWNAPWVNKDDLAEEDFWAIPKFSRLLIKQSERAERKDKLKARA